MDRRERAGDPQTALLAALQGWQSGVYTALPAAVVPIAGGSSFDPAKRTVSVQPSVRAQVQQPDGTWLWVALPLLVDCPVFFPGGGGVTLTFPIRVGDECLVVFSNRCIDAWWQSGGIQNQPELRMHDLSDGFAFVGVSSVPQVVPSISATVAQLRDDAGTTYIELDPGGTFVNVVTPGSVSVTAGGDLTATVGGSMEANVAGSATVSAGGDLNLAAGGSVNITGVLVINGEPYLDHTHSKVKSGLDDTGGVNS